MKTGVWIAIGAGIHNVGAGLAIDIGLGAALGALSRWKKPGTPDDQ